MNKPRCVLRLMGDGYPDMLVGELSFSWKVEGAFGIQSEYRLAVSEKPDGEGDMWDTGWVKSQTSAGIAYGGKPFESNRAYYAKVAVRSSEGIQIDDSESVKFETGYMSQDEWQSDWLCAPYALSSAVSPVFRKEFSIDKPVKRARLFICGLGYYELYINGAKINDRVMDPSWTDFNKRVCYVANDVTQFLRVGQNAVGVWLGAGWYANYEAMPRPRFTSQLMLEYEDGSREIMPSRAGDGWMVQKHSPILKNTIYIGEVYDARLEIDGWAKPGLNMPEDEWAQALWEEPPVGKLVPMRAEPIRVIREMPVIKMTTPRPGVFVLDFGQNMAAVLRLNIDQSEPGVRIGIRYSEILDSEGMLSTENLRKGQARDEYITKAGRQSYQARFTYHGFRYAEITGLDTFRPEQATALVVRNDVGTKSKFSTSNELVNAIQRICVWTENNNMHSVPTDCPQRDERLGWLNDFTVRIEEAIFNFDVDGFYQKFLVDIADTQGEKTGAIADTAPYVIYGAQPADPVCASYVLLPWMLYRHYGDAEVVRRAYLGVKAWTDYLAKSRVNGLVPYSYYGDWAAPIGGSIRGSVGNGAVSAITPGKLMSTGFLYLDCLLISDMARTLGFDSDAQSYESLARDVAKALNEAFLNADDGFYATNSQASNTFMLYLGIVPDELRAKVVKNLVDDIMAHDVHTTTGNICTRYILDVLADNGHIDTAFDIVTQTTYPSWGYMLSRGATTTWERWEYVDSGELVGMASHDHPMYSTVSGWFYKYLAGFYSIEPGFKSFELRPFYPRKLDHAEAKVSTVKGDAAVSWTKSESNVTIEIEVPFNSVCDFAITTPGAFNVTADGKPANVVCGKVKLASGRHTVSFSY